MRMLCRLNDISKCGLHMNSDAAEKYSHVLSESSVLAAIGHPRPPVKEPPLEDSKSQKGHYHAAGQAADWEYHRRAVDAN